MKKIIVSSQNQVYVVDQKDTIMCKADNCYTILYMRNGKKFMVCKSLSKFIEKFDATIFIRVSQSYFINKEFIVSIDKKKKHLELINEIFVPFTVTLKVLIGAINQPMA